MGSIRKIASNRLWRPQGLVCDPLVSISEQGRVLAMGFCTEPDREPFAEFYAGVLVPDFPAAWREAFELMKAARPARPLDELLREVVPAPDGVLVVIEGLDYQTMRLTEQSAIRKI